MIDSLFTLESLMSLEGAAVVAWLIPNVLGYIIGEKFSKIRKYVSLGISLGIAFFIAIIANVEWTGYVIALLNGFLIFASAVGINQVTNQKKEPMHVSFMKLGTAKSRTKKKFFKSWF